MNTRNTITFFVGGTGAVLFLTMAIIYLMQYIYPVLCRKIYLECLKDKLHDIKTDLLSSILMMLTWLSSFTFLLYYTLVDIANATTPMILVKICSLVLVIFSTISPTLVCTLSCQRIISLSQEIRLNSPVKEKLMVLVDSYYDLNYASQPYLLLSYSCSALCITAECYSVAIISTGCRISHMV